MAAGPTTTEKQAAETLLSIYHNLPAINHPRRSPFTMTEIKRAIESVVFYAEEDSDSSAEKDSDSSAQQDSDSSAEEDFLWYFRMESPENFDVSLAMPYFELELDLHGFPVFGDPKSDESQPEAKHSAPENMMRRRSMYTHLRKGYLDKRMGALNDRLRDNSAETTEKFPWPHLLREFPWPYLLQECQLYGNRPYNQWTADQKDAFTLFGAWHFQRKYKLNTPGSECLCMRDAVAALLLDFKIISAREDNYPNEKMRQWLDDEMRYLAVLSARRLSAALAELEKVQQSVCVVAEAAARLVKEPRDVRLDRRGLDLDIARFSNIYDGPLIEDAKCTICQEIHAENDAVELEVCGHVFGAQCLETWVNKTHRATDTCPNCRRTLFPKSYKLQDSEGRVIDRGFDDGLGRPFADLIRARHVQGIAIRNMLTLLAAYRHTFGDLDNFLERIRPHYNVPNVEGELHRMWGEAVGIIGSRILNGPFKPPSPRG
ncbi:hypothetical protein BU16DRAFT_333442 [Lophium mytilinum]|uniref:RING-type domain-containing protein n=1 Tax=Lophium mytilinum TaxID=390894 RepID=A0A6A6R029_9PEZI|nr:hypothetical protein BU16DRAFT_333442 [Lophium mytilinum]